LPQKRKRQILEKEQAEKKLEGETQQGNVGYFKRTKNPSTTSLGKLQKTIRPTELLTPDSTDLFLLRLDDWYVELRGVNAVTTQPQNYELVRRRYRNFPSFPNGESAHFKNWLEEW